MWAGRQSLSWCGAVALLTGCGGMEGQLGAGAPPLSVSARYGAGPATKQFGVGLGDLAGADGSGGSKGQSWTFDYCNGSNGNPSQCYNETPGKRKYHESASGTAYLFYGTQSVGYTKAQITATEKLGTASYTMYAETNASRNLGRGFVAFSQIVASNWDDTLYISSTSLKKGTPVSIGVTWTLAPQTNIGCDSAKDSSGELELYSASITPSSGTQFSITGICSGGSFVYYLYNEPTKPGTKAVGTISTAVGDSYPIYFATSGLVQACQTSSQCIGDYVASLSGNDKFKITSITSGATYTTASGNTYK